MLVFPTILFNNTMMKIVKIYVSIITSGSLLPGIIINQWRENSQHYILSHPTHYKILMDAHIWAKDGRIIEHSMLDFHWENCFVVK